MQSGFTSYKYNKLAVHICFLMQNANSHTPPPPSSCHKVRMKPSPQSNWGLQAQGHYESLAVRRALHEWRLETHAQSVHSEKLMVAAMRWRQMSLASALATWIQWHQEQRQQQQTLNLVLQFWAHSHASHVFVAWQEWACGQASLREKVCVCSLQEQLQLSAESAPPPPPLPPPPPPAAQFHLFKADAASWARKRTMRCGSISRVQA